MQGSDLIAKPLGALLDALLPLWVPASVSRQLAQLCFSFLSLTLICSVVCIKSFLESVWCFSDFLHLIINLHCRV